NRGSTRHRSGLMARWFAGGKSRKPRRRPDDKPPKMSSSVGRTSRPTAASQGPSSGTPTAAPNDARRTGMPVRWHCRIINRTRDPRRGIPSMKHPTDRPTEQVMRFFTPELYVQFNSPDDEVADRANEAWETALQSYQNHLTALRP